MAKTLAVLFAATLAGSAANAAPVPIQYAGNSGAEGELLQDIVQNLVNYGAIFDCASPTTLKATALDPRLHPSNTGLSSSEENAPLEEWEADYCGEKQRFSVRYWPDPNGGTFISIDPYRDGAPSLVPK